MPYRQVTMLEIKEFPRLGLDGKTKKRIAALLGSDSITVVAYIRAA